MRAFCELAYEQSPKQDETLRKNVKNPQKREKYMTAKKIEKIDWPKLPKKNLDFTY